MFFFRPQEIEYPPPADNADGRRATREGATLWDGSGGRVTYAVGGGGKGKTGAAGARRKPLRPRRTGPAQNCGDHRRSRILCGMTTEPMPGAAPPVGTQSASAVPPASANDAPQPVDYASGATAGYVSRYRWVVLALVFFAITINYIDRMVMGLVAPEIRSKFGIDAKAYGYITAAFGLSYALGQLASGRWLEWIGTRIGYAIALAAWSVVSMLHAVAGSALGFGARSVAFAAPLNDVTGNSPQQCLCPGSVCASNTAQG